MSAAKVQHIHAELIKAWADDPSLEIEWRHMGQDWKPCDEIPKWKLFNEYRVKPAPAAKVYPVTGMTHSDLARAFEPRMDGGLWSSVAAANIANAALRHAIDANEILTLADHQSAITAFGERLRDAEIARHSGREMAIAEAVQHSCKVFADLRPSTAEYEIKRLDLAAIIATVLPC